MFLEHGSRVAYIAIPKTGSYSIHSYFGYFKNHPEPSLHHMGVRMLIEQHPEARDYFKFAFVRNPWDKLVSMYFDFTKRRIRKYSTEVILDKPLLSEFTDFEDFCIRLKESDWVEDVFFRPQHEFVTYENGDVIDFVGRVERLNDDFQEVCRMNDLECRPLERKNVGPYDHKGYRQFYTSPASIDAVGDLYHEDVVRFQYEF